ncbi:MAG: 4Fe-4S dicluster domain-containing protein, partial [Erysipelotrichales bacterium]
MNFAISIDPIDCTGCGNCAEVCPAKGKALVMKPAHTQKHEMENFEYATKMVTIKENMMNKNTVKGSQFQKPLLE